MKRIRSHVTYANVVATMALVFAIGGGTAVALRGVNKVRSDDIKNGQVKSADLQNNGVTGTDVNEGTLDLPDSPTVVARGTMALPGLINLNQCSGDVTESVPAAQDGDTVLLGFSGNFTTLQTSVFAEADAGQIEYSACNHSGVNQNYGTVENVKYMVIR